MTCSGKPDWSKFGPRLFLVTGGLGFIGKHFVQSCLENGHYVTNVDVVNYAADRKVAEQFKDYERYRHIQADIAALKYMPECDVLVNFAAETHVDNSIASSRQFCETNFLGTQRLLELVRWKAPSERPQFVQISTDEVYGDIENGGHLETDPLKPSNPYSSTKAASDLLILGWSRTYGVPYNIIRMSNNYGRHQYPEKLIPKSAARLLRGKRAVLHGSGQYHRNWLHVEDAVEGVFHVVFFGAENKIYNIGGSTELANIEVVRRLANIIGVRHEDAFEFIEDRVGQDIRYNLICDEINKLGWRASRDFDEELVKIVDDIDFHRFI